MPEAPPTGASASEGEAGDQNGIPRWQKVGAAVGILIWLVGGVSLLVLYKYAPTQALAGALAVTTFYYAGQFGSIPMGLAAGGHPLLVAAYVLAADAAGLLVFFPLTQLAVDKLAARRGLIARWIRRIQERAQRRRQFVERYGPWGLFAFTLPPFLFNSPILGATLGRVAGIPARKTLFAILAAVAIMSFCWTAVFELGLAAARAEDQRLPWFFGIGSVLVTVLVAAIIALARHLRKPVPAPDDA